jgi:hypothetical protein
MEEHIRLNGELRTSHCGDLILGILSRIDSTKVGLLIRHAAKEKNDDQDEAKLSDLGHRDAQRFGKFLPRNRDVQITYSPSLRCADTVAEIVRGLAQGESMHIQDAGSEQFLAAFQFFSKNLKAMESTKLELGTKVFLRKWLNGEIKEDVVWSPLEVRNYLSTYFHNELLHLKPTTLRIWISHDFSIALIRELLFGARFETNPWISYLDGLVLINDPQNNLRAFWNNNGESALELKSKVFT